MIAVRRWLGRLLCLLGHHQWLDDWEHVELPVPMDLRVCNRRGCYGMQTRPSQ